VTDQEFGEQLAALRPRLARLAQAYFVPEPEDLIQDTMLLAWRGRGQYRGDASLFTWTSRILLNRLRDVRRRSNVRRNEFPMDEDIAVIDPEPNAEERLLARDTRIPEVMRVVVKLRPVLRESIQFNLREDRPALTNTQKVRRFRAIQEIRRRLHVSEKKAA